MRWPLMSVRVHERCMESYSRDLNAAITQSDRAERRTEQLVKAERERYDALLEKYHALKASGASVPEPKPALSIAKPSGPIADAIDDVCAKFGNNVRLRRRLNEYAAKCKKDAPDMDTADIAHAILHWRDPDADEDAT